MDIIRSDKIPLAVPDWYEQLASLTRTVWSGPDGTCYFPYKPLTTPAFWAHEIKQGWEDGSISSWILLDGDRIVSHAALLNKGTHWELGRLMSHHAGKTGTSELCQERMNWTRAQNIHARMECTQAHTSAQWHADQVGMRFAGIGFLGKINGINWDIIFFDTLEESEFVPVPSVLGDPLGQEIICSHDDRERLREIVSILTTERWEPLPPKKFHVLPRLLEPVNQIIAMNMNEPSSD